jgi:hypothetical protein
LRIVFPDTLKSRAISSIQRRKRAKWLGKAQHAFGNLDAAADYALAYLAAPWKDCAWAIARFGRPDRRRLYLTI